MLNQYIFLSGSGGTGTSHLVQVIYNAISKILLYHCKDLEKSRVLLLGPTRISAVNIYVEPPFIYSFIIYLFICSGLGIKPGTKLLGLNDKSKAFLKNRL